MLRHDSDGGIADMEAECALIGYVVGRAAAFDSVADIVDISDFTDARHRRLFAVTTMLSRDAMVETRVREAASWATVDLGYVHSLVRRAPGTGRGWAKRLRHATLDRRDRRWSA